MLWLTRNIDLRKFGNKTYLFPDTVVIHRVSLERQHYIDRVWLDSIINYNLCVAHNIRDAFHKVSCLR